MKSFLPAIFVVLFFLISFQQTDAQKLAVIPYVSGINYPIDVKNCGDDRLFIADKGGFIRIINADGTLRSAPFLDISSKMVAASEDGLMGIVFSLPIIKRMESFMLIILEVFPAIQLHLSKNIK
jgi:hypothetical protein